MYLFSAAQSAWIDRLMEMAQTLTLNHLLAARGMTGKALAKRLDVTEATVSRLRNGLAPSAQMKPRIIEALELNEHEIRALGWEVDDG